MIKQDHRKRFVALTMSAVMTFSVVGPANGFFNNYLPIISADLDESNAYVLNFETESKVFDKTSTWDEVNSDGYNINLSTSDIPKVGTSLVLDVLLKISEEPSFNGIIKTTGVLRCGSNWDWVQSASIPELTSEDFTEKITIGDDEYYKASISIPFGETVGANVNGEWNSNASFADAVNGVVSAVTVKFAGYQCDYEGVLGVANARLEEGGQAVPILEPKDPIVISDFSTGIDGFKSEAGWDYSHGKVVEDGTPSEEAEVEWDEEEQRLKVILDYSQNLGSSWSEAKVTGTFDEVDVSCYNVLTFKLIYPSEMESVRTKIFMANTSGESELINTEGTFPKEVTKLDDGYSEALIKASFTPADTTVSSVTIGIVGPYANLSHVYIDDVMLDQADASGDYVKITSIVKDEIDKADISNLASNVKIVDSEATDATKILVAYMSSLSASGQVLFGHQNSTFRSVIDDGNTSDIKSITGTEAGLFGIDSLALAGQETGQSTREDALNASIEASKKAFNAGSIITLSCHMPNFTNSKIIATGDEQHPYDFTTCDFGESKDLSPCADYILEGGEYNDVFNAYLDIIADYALELQKDDIPVLFRPFHENSGGWFWWGTSTSVESYQAMWRYTVNYLESKGVHNFLYVYSPNGPIESEEQYFERYPGDAYVDVIAFDYYDDYADINKYTGDNYFAALAKSCKIVKQIADSKEKIAAIAETGIRITGAGKDSLMVSGNPTTGHDWYNKVIETASENGIPYFLLWANFNSANFFVPFKYSDTLGQEMINEFIDAYNNEKSIFGNGTNFYVTGESGDEDSAISKADTVTLEGYSDKITGYMITPKNYQTIKEPAVIEAKIKNASKVEFIISESENAAPVTLEGIKGDGDIYSCEITKEILEKINATSTGTIVIKAYDEDDMEVEIGKASFINFNKDPDVFEANVFDNFELYYGDNGLLQSKYGSANSASGCYSEVYLDKNNKVEGDYGLAFSYTLTYKGTETWTGGLGRTFDSADFSEYNAVSMWVKPDGNGQKMVIQLYDESGKEYEAYLSDFVKGSEAKYVTIPFTSFIVKGDTYSIDPSSIAGYRLWCNTIPDNYTGEKDENGNYVVSGIINFDDIKAVKIGEEDLAKVDEKGLIITDKPLTDDNEENPGDSDNNDNNDKQQDDKKEDSKTVDDNNNKSNVNVLAKGTVFKDKKSKLKFIVTVSDETKGKVSCKGLINKKAKSAVIPAKVTKDGVTYKVTAIANKAFYKNKKLKKVVVPSTVLKIGKKAFYGCKNLKNIKVKTKRLKTKTVGKAAFKGIYKKAKVKVPKKKLKAYKKLFKKKGMGKKVRFTK